MTKKLINLAAVGYVALTSAALALASAALGLTSAPLTLAQRPPIIPTGADTTEKLLIPKSPTGSAEETYFGGVFLPQLTTTIIAMAGVTAVLFIIVGGIQILTAYGNDEKIGKGKKTITFAIVGLLVAILSYAIVSIISAINLTPRQ